MPAETSRTTARKKVKLPGGETIDVPVITKISFIDPYERYQEWEYSIDNSEESGRTVRVDAVPSSDNGVASPETIQVERIKTWPHIDVYDRGQETQPEMDNETGKDDIPPHFSSHLQTHTVKYKKRDEDGNLDDDVWIESELIDSFTVVDPYDRYQQKIFTLNNPQNDEDAQADPDDPDITNGDGSGEGTIETPVRLDPFQNIVNFSGGYLLRIQFVWFDFVIGHNIGQVGFETSTVTSANVLITDVTPTTPEATLLLNNLRPPIQYATSSPGGVPAYQHIQDFVFDLKGLPIVTSAVEPMQITFSITGQGDFTGYVVLTHVGGNIDGMTEVQDGPLGSGRPYASPDISAYSKTKWHFDETDPNDPIKPNDPTDPGGVAFAMRIERPTVIGIPSTDIFWYPGPPWNGTSLTIVAGGSYFDTGLFVGGSFVLNLENLPVVVDGEEKHMPVIYPKTPGIRDVPYGIFGSPVGASIVEIALMNYVIPNPFPPYALGIYTHTGKGGKYKFGGPPVASNKYNGTYPIAGT